jgi:RND family efflux transporter MFP subunit
MRIHGRWFAGALLISLTIASGCARPPRDDHQSELPTTAGHPTVDYIIPVIANSTFELELPCTLKEGPAEAIYPRIGGYLKEWYCDAGQSVRKGEVLGTVESLPVPGLQLKDAQSNVDTAKAELGAAQFTLTGYEKIAAEVPGAVAPKLIDNQRGNVRRAQNHLKAANARLAEAEANARTSAATKPASRPATMRATEELLAPFDGIVTARNFEVGDVISPDGSTAGDLRQHPANNEVFDVAPTDTLSAFIHLPQDYRTAVKQDQTARLTVGTSAGSCVGVVKQMGGSVDPQSRTVPVRIEFADNTGKIFPGQFGMIHLTIAQANPPLLIPTSALIFDAPGLWVAVIGDDNRIGFRQIKLRRDLGTDAEVVSGLSTADHVVANPADVALGASVVQKQIPYFGHGH